MGEKELQVRDSLGLWLRDLDLRFAVGEVDTRDSHELSHRGRDPLAAVDLLNLDLGFDGLVSFGRRLKLGRGWLVGNEQSRSARVSADQHEPEQRAKA